MRPDQNHENLARWARSMWAAARANADPACREACAGAAEKLERMMSQPTRTSAAVDHELAQAGA